jgi:hypothetical protein
MQQSLRQKREGSLQRLSRGYSTQSKSCTLELLEAPENSVVLAF